MQFLALVVLFVTALGTLTYVCIPQGRHRVMATGLFLLLSFGAFAVTFESLGTPKPVAVEWRSLAKLPLLAFYADEANQKVYVWVLRDGAPVSYVFPWPSDATVEELQDMLRKGKQEGDQFELSGDDDIAHVRIDPPLPPKEIQ